MIPELARLRIEMIRAAQRAGHAHLPSAFSILELVYTLHKYVLNKDDEFILSKGHGVLALYAVQGRLAEYAAGILPGHPERSEGIAATTGSLGHGLGLAAGIAMGKRQRGESGRVFCLLGDQECEEGSVQEAARIIVAQHLDVIALIDCNTHKAPRWEGWKRIAIRGHDSGWERKLPFDDTPLMIMAATVKGYGVSEMIENSGAWHHRAPTEEEAQRFIDEIQIRYLPA